MDTTMRGRRGGEGGERRGWSKERKRMHGRGGEATCENMPWTVEVDYHGDIDIIVMGVGSSGWRMVKAQGKEGVRIRSEEYGGTRCA